MTPGPSGALPRTDELARLVADLRRLFGALLASEEALLDAFRKLEEVLASGADGRGMLAEIEREAERHGVAQEVLSALAGVVSRLLDGDEKSPSESSAADWAKAGR